MRAAWIWENKKKPGRLHLAIYFFRDPYTHAYICRQKIRLLICMYVRVCMYVCMYRGCPSWSTHGIGRPTGPGEGAHQKWVQCPNLAGTIGPVSCTLAHTYARSAFCSQLCSGQLWVSCILI